MCKNHLKKAAINSKGTIIPILRQKKVTQLKMLTQVSCFCKATVIVYTSNIIPIFSFGKWREWDRYYYHYLKDEKMEVLRVQSSEHPVWGFSNLTVLPSGTFPSEEAEEHVRLKKASARGPQWCAQCPVFPSLPTSGRLTAQDVEA